MATTIPRSGVRKVPLSGIKNDLSRFLREAEGEEIVIIRDWVRRGYGNSLEDRGAGLQFVEDREREASAWPGSRVFVPRLPHHVTQRGNRRESAFFGARIISFAPPDRDGGAARRRRDLGLLPDAQLCPFDCHAGGEEWAVADL